MKVLALVLALLASQYASAATLTVVRNGSSTLANGQWSSKDVTFKLINGTYNAPELEIVARDTVAKCTISAEVVHKLDMNLGQLATYLSAKNAGILCKMSEDPNLAATIVLFEAGAGDITP
jgi:hypothetical protein